MFRTMTLAAAATAALATAAAASDSYIGFQGKKVAPTNFVTLDTVRAYGDGIIEIYDFHAGEQGDLLGSAQISDGANANVKVMLDTRLSRDAIAVLKVDGQVVDTFEFDVEL